MKVPAELLALLRERAGLDPEVLGAALLERVWARHRHVPIATLATGGTAWIDLLDELVVPETWLFREERAFEYLQKWLRETWLPAHSHTHFHALSLPCATGEEAYSIAATALHAGLQAGHVHIAGGDISPRAVAASERGYYHGRSVKLAGKHAALAHFETAAGGLRAGEALRRCVEFRTMNILTAGGLSTTFPVIFCRNLLIYLTREARTVALQNLQRLLAPGGLLFLGHADTVSGLDERFERLPVEGAFAYQHRSASAAATRAVSKPAVPARRSAVRATRRAPTRVIPEHSLERARKMADNGAMDDARKELQALLRTHGSQPEAWYLLGLLHSVAGDMREAEICYERTLALNPDHGEAAMHLALLVDDRPSASSSSKRSGA